MIDQIKMVEEFHIKFLHTMSDYPVNISEQEAELRYKLGKEELDEYLTAAKNNDFSFSSLNPLTNFNIAEYITSI